MMENHSLGEQPTHFLTPWCAKCREHTRVLVDEDDPPEELACSVCRNPYSRGEAIEYSVHLAGLRRAATAGRLRGEVLL